MQNNIPYIQNMHQFVIFVNIFLIKWSDMELLMQPLTLCFLYTSQTTGRKQQNQAGKPSTLIARMLRCTSLLPPYMVAGQAL